MTKTYHFMAPKVAVWDYDGFAIMLNEGVVITAPVQTEIAEFLGLKVFADNTLPPGRVELRHPETGAVLMAFNLTA